MPDLPAGTVTFLFTDIEGSTRLWEEHPESMRVALAQHDALVREAVDSNGGHIFKTMGDAFCAAFQHASEAVQAAVSVQAAIIVEQWAGGVTLRVRIALHTGSVESRDGDYFGPPLNRVSRLLATGRGGQVLLSDVTHDLCRDSLPNGCSIKPLGEYRLKDLGRPESVFQLCHPDLPSDFPRLRSLESLPNNLPQQLTSFIGREKELHEIKALLQKTRLLSLTGSGGCGKTRLALQAAAELADGLADGAWLIELAPLTDPSLVPHTAASVFALKEEPGRPVQQTLTAHLRDKRLLLLLDNCEHVLSACAVLVDAVLRQCPQVTILASSREPLGIGGETTYRIPSLTLPDPKQPQTPERLRQCEAARLFIERAGQARTDFTVTDQNASAVASVCRRLDGIPLAIELAAARIRSLSVEGINTRLDQRFRLLTGGSRTALPRQQTLHALIDWSYNLLSAQEKALLCRLSVFAGGWTLEAAEQVCSGDSPSGETIDSFEILDLLTSLTDKSLAIAEIGGGATRFRMLETIRQFAMERLLESDEGREVRRRHRDWFLTLAKQVEPELWGSEQAHWLSVLEAEHDNLRQALAFSLEAPDGAQHGLRLGASLGRFWWTRGHLSEGRERLAALLAQAESQARTKPRADALYTIGLLAFLQGEYGPARTAFEDGLAIARELGEEETIAYNTIGLGLVVYFQGDIDRSSALFTLGLARQRELGNPRGIAWPLYGLGLVAYARADYPLANARLAEGLALFRELGDMQGISACLLALGTTYHLQRNYDLARALQEESLQIARESGDTRGVAGSLHYLGLVASSQGDYISARAQLEESLSIRGRLSDRQGIAASVEALASLADKAGNRERAVRLWGAASSLREAITSPLSAIDRNNQDRELASARESMGEAVFDAAFTEGRAMTLEQAIEYALSEADEHA